MSRGWHRKREALCLDKPGRAQCRGGHSQGGHGDKSRGISSGRLARPSSAPLKPEALPPVEATGRASPASSPGSGAS